MTMTNRGYFNSSIKAWRARLNREHRSMTARLKVLRGVNHPCAADQEELMAVNREMLAVVERHASAIPAQMKKPAAAFRPRRVESTGEEV